MKKLLLILASFIVVTPVIADNKLKNEVTDSFTDRVKMIREDDKEITVQFTRNTILYKMAKSNPRYEEFKSKLEKLKTEEKKVRVVAIMPMMEIKDIIE
ncbi:MAG: hypothetical protein Q7U04_09070 [Bacteriovorax sp.]|nr:hypothetical protein [Bacteriovorax sp.]